MREKKTSSKKTSTSSLNEEDMQLDEDNDNDHGNGRIQSRNDSPLDDECEEASPDCEDNEGEEKSTRGRKKVVCSSLEWAIHSEESMCSFSSPSSPP